MCYFKSFSNTSTCRHYTGDTSANAAKAKATTLPAACTHRVQIHCTHCPHVIHTCTLLINEIRSSESDRSWARCSPRPATTGIITRTGHNTDSLDWISLSSTVRTRKHTQGRRSNTYKKTRIQTALLTLRRQRPGNAEAIARPGVAADCRAVVQAPGTMHRHWLEAWCWLRELAWTPPICLVKLIAMYHRMADLMTVH